MQYDVGTHDGGFHADDVFAVAALIFRGGLKSPKILRTRSIRDLNQCKFVVDVGGVHDPKTLRFDHHQKGGAGARENGIPYASFGLVWKYLAALSPSEVEIFQEVDRILVQGIDAGDCGVSLHKRGDYDASAMSLSSVIASLNPTWMEEKDYDSAFAGAVGFALTILHRVWTRVEHEFAAEDVVQAAVDNAEDPRIIVMERSCPWQEVVTRSVEALYVVFPEPNGYWYIKAVPPHPFSFAQRKPLPESWAGLGEDLSEIVGVDAMFCHNQRFIAGAKSREAAVTMAKIAADA
jgi:uncharacterized UPF0160 family protein